MTKEMTKEQAIEILQSEMPKDLKRENRLQRHNAFQLAIKAMEQMPDEDCISREQAIEAVKAIRYGLWEIDIPSPTVPEYREHHEQVTELMGICDNWIKKLSEYSSVQPKRLTAEWLSDKYGHITCSNCGGEAYWDTDYGQQEFEYCHHCGRYMGGEEDV